MLVDFDELARYAEEQVEILGIEIGWAIVINLGGDGAQAARAEEGRQAANRTAKN